MISPSKALLWLLGGGLLLSLVGGLLLRFTTARQYGYVESRQYVPHDPAVCRDLVTVETDTTDHDHYTVIYLRRVWVRVPCPTDG